MGSSRRVQLNDHPDKVSILVSADSASQRVFHSSDLWTVFSPHTQSNLAERFPAQESSPVPVKNNSRSPEQRLALVAFRLAVLEKIATGLGKLAFVWATVVLLGGYVSDIDEKDFWIISALLITEGTRVFSRSSELEWQQTNYSLGIVQMSSFLVDKSMKFWNRTSDQRTQSELTSTKYQKALYQGYGAKRTWSWGTVPIIPFTSFISTKTISLLLYLLQLASAGVTISLSVIRLVEHGSFNKDNVGRSLALFYSMMLGEASLFLVERAYWEFKLRYQRLMHRVIEKCELEEDNIDTIKQYYYAVYSRSLNGSVFEALNLDLIDFTLEKLQSGVREEQLDSVQILSTLVFKGVSREETRRRIATTRGVVERLLEMITWKDMSEKEMRKASTLVIGSLVRHRNNAYRISAVPGSLEAVISLLLGEGKDFQEDIVSGLITLIELAKDQRTCVRIGNTTGVISILVSFLRLEESTNLRDKSTWKIVKKSLQLLRMMTDAGGESGHLLRKKIASMVFTVSNLQQLCQVTTPKQDLQGLAVDILTCLATADELRDCVGATGGVISSLLEILKKETDEKTDTLPFRIRMRAGEAISLLVLQNPENCSRILNHKSYIKQQEEVVSQNFVDLIGMLSRPHIGIHAATILRSLSGELNRAERLKIGEAAPGIVDMVLESIEKEQEAAIGLAAAVVPLMHRRMFHASFYEKKELLIEKIVELISQVPRASLNRMRRYSVELLNALMVKDGRFLEGLRRHGGVGMLLERMLETVSDVENFYTFSGVVGLTRHSVSLQQLINLALTNLHSL